jgi:hypothetical protein
MLATQAQVANLFGGPGGLQQAQAALQAHATLRQRRQPCRQVSTSIADYVLKHDSRFEDTPSGVGVSASSMGHRRRQGSVAIRASHQQLQPKCRSCGDDTPAGRSGVPAATSAPAQLRGVRRSAPASSTSVATSPAV